MAITIIVNVNQVGISGFFPSLSPLYGPGFDSPHRLELTH